MELEEKKSSIVKQIKSLCPNFIIGTAAAAHQVEGGNINDWTEFEKKDGKIARGEKSGLACDHYNLYPLDFEMLKNFGFKAHRLSIEWSRIVPQTGRVNQEEIDHYRDVLRSLKEHHQISFVTLHHFTSPIWFMKMGGFEKKKNLIHWKEFVEIICHNLGDLIDVFNTINEPYVYTAAGYFQGVHSPGFKSIIKYFKVGNNLMRAHFIAVEIINKICPGKKVGIVKNLVVLRTYHWWNLFDFMTKKFFDWSFNSAPLKALSKQKIPFGWSKIKYGAIGDFIGINHYNVMTVGLGLPGLMVPHIPDDTKLTKMNWGVYPSSLKEVLLRAYNIVKLPIYITENGIATDNDQWRKEIILEFMQSAVDAMKEGVDIYGYFYWSNLDNFEWAEGFLDGGFGLISVDFDTFERKPNESAKMLGEMAKIIFDKQNQE